jgi:hypothetical protein
MTTQPIAGNQNYTGISTLAQQLPKLSVGTLNSSDSSAALLTTGDTVVQTMVVGVVDFKKFTAVGEVLLVTNRHTNKHEHVILPANSEVLSCHYSSTGGDLTVVSDPPASTQFNIGFGSAAAAPVVGAILVLKGTDTIANGATGGLVMGEQVAGSAQVFGKDGDTTTVNSQLTLTTPAGPNDHLVVTAAAPANLSGSSGLLEVTLRYAVRS